ncbi:MAG: TetR/AcrR family transcriptional regulator [Paracoccaceae bacterium]
MTDTPRNREDTRQRILNAALDLLAKGGFGALGINAVAREAGADKQLIYRYFGGMDGLTEAMGLAVAEELTAALAPSADPPPGSYADLMERLALALFDYLAGNARYRQIRAVEIAAPSPATAAFATARGRAIRNWVLAARGGLAPPEGIDAPALNAALIATVEGMTVLGAAGMPLDDAASRARARAALRRLVRGAYVAG